MIFVAKITSFFQLNAAFKTNLVDPLESFEADGAVSGPDSNLEAILNFYLNRTMAS
jgi:hypothetical protein